MKDFKGKVAVITGGASGVGRAIAHLLAKEGAKVVVADIEAKALDRTVSELAALGCECMGQRADVTDASSMNSLVDAVMARFGAIHLVFANAGVGLSLIHI